MTRSGSACDHTGVGGMATVLEACGGSASWLIPRLPRDRVTGRAHLAFLAFELTADGIRDRIGVELIPPPGPATNPLAGWRRLLDGLVAAELCLPSERDDLLGLPRRRRGGRLSRALAGDPQRVRGAARRPRPGGQPAAPSRQAGLGATPLAAKVYFGFLQHWRFPRPIGGPPDEDSVPTPVTRRATLRTSLANPGRPRTRPGRPGRRRWRSTWTGSPSTGYTIPTRRSWPAGHRLSSGCWPFVDRAALPLVIDPALLAPTRSSSSSDGCCDATRQPLRRRPGPRAPGVSRRPGHRAGPLLAHSAELAPVRRRRLRRAPARRRAARPGPRVPDLGPVGDRAMSTWRAAVDELVTRLAEDRPLIAERLCAGVRLGRGDPRCSAGPPIPTTAAAR